MSDLQIRMVAGFAEIAERKEILVAGPATGAREFIAFLLRHSARGVGKPQYAERLRNLFRLWIPGFWIVNTNVGGKLIVALGFVFPLHFIE
jgi:hypothetical protein